MRITVARATTVAVPLEAPPCHADGVRRGRVLRGIVEVIDDEGRPDRFATAQKARFADPVLRSLPFMAGAV